MGMSNQNITVGADDQIYSPAKSLDEYNLSNDVVLLRRDKIEALKTDLARARIIKAEKSTGLLYVQFSDGDQRRYISKEYGSEAGSMYGLALKRAMELAKHETGAVKEAPAETGAVKEKTATSKHETGAVKEV